ncbi:putative NADP-dependent mannitol dehydrogenase [Cytospora mali]|uniref:NADP-dependent mannitol dehydrogenase n=1 Tax=Cytospora mali TaxID=578113 RepID=A0A194V6K4_CYTMA|nr:putative NADP-dependent mannitol dehydrogenase [Valsa mali var. pyri (nom. inval.)]
MPLFKPENVNTPVLSQFSLQGKIAAVTGGAKGIGKEIVRGLAEAGADVALIYGTSTQAAQDTATEVSAATGQRVTPYQCDVSNREETAAVINTICEEFGHGRLDVVVANAGVCADIPSLEYTEETWRANNGVNLDGVMWTAQAAGKIFKRRGKGNLIVTASVSATLINVPQRQVAYNASKAAAVHLAKGLAVEWADFARVNCVSPGFIMTEMLTKQPAELFDRWLGMIPGGRICDAAELKSAYVFLASDACSYMTGADIIIDGGYTLT